MRIGVLSDSHLHRSERDLRRVFGRYLIEVDLIFHTGVSSERMEVDAS